MIKNNAKRDIQEDFQRYTERLNELEQGPEGEAVKEALEIRGYLFNDDHCFRRIEFYEILDRNKWRVPVPGKLGTNSSHYAIDSHGNLDILPDRTPNWIMPAFRFELTGAEVRKFHLTQLEMERVPNQEGK